MGRCHLVWSKLLGTLVRAKDPCPSRLGEGHGGVCALANA